MTLHKVLLSIFSFLLASHMVNKLDGKNEPFSNVFVTAFDDPIFINVTHEKIVFHFQNIFTNERKSLQHSLLNSEWRCVEEHGGYEGEGVD
jgi:hypothetical protein